MVSYIKRKLDVYNSTNRNTMRIEYWSGSNWAIKLKEKFNIPSPTALSSDDWRAYHEKYESHFIMKFLDQLDFIQEILHTPIDIYDNIFRYIRNRFVHKTHYINTRLEKGSYHEFEEKILHGLFNEFIDFIEKEKGFSKRRHVFDDGRDADAALKYLNWEIHECDNNPQAASAVWQLAAYNWWKFERPQRPDPYEKSGMTDYFDKDRKENLSFLSDKKFNELSSVCDEIISQYHQEDTRLMIELINRRSEMWT